MLKTSSFDVVYKETVYVSQTGVSYFFLSLFYGNNICPHNFYICLPKLTKTIALSVKTEVVVNKNILFCLITCE